MDQSMKGSNNKSKKKSGGEKEGEAQTKRRPTKSSLPPKPPPMPRSFLSFPLLQEKKTLARLAGGGCVGLENHPRRTEGRKEGRNVTMDLDALDSVFWHGKLAGSSYELCLHQQKKRRAVQFTKKKTVQSKAVNTPVQSNPIQTKSIYVRSIYSTGR